MGGDLGASGNGELGRRAGLRSGSHAASRSGRRAGCRRCGGGGELWGAMGLGEWGRLWIGFGTGRAAFVVSWANRKKRRTFSSMAPTPSASARLSIFRRHREFSQAKNLRYMFPGGNNYFHESSCHKITIFHGGLHSTLTKIGFHDGICSTSTKNTNFMRVCFKLSRKIHPLTKSRFCGSERQRSPTPHKNEGDRGRRGRFRFSNYQ